MHNHAKVLPNFPLGLGNELSRSFLGDTKHLADFLVGPLLLVGVQEAMDLVPRICVVVDAGRPLAGPFGVDPSRQAVSSGLRVHLIQVHRLAIPAGIEPSLTTVTG